MYKKITRYQKKLHALMETIYDAYGIPYDFNLHTTLSNFQNEEDAQRYYDGRSHQMMLLSAMGEFPLDPMELENKTMERMKQDEADGLFEPQLVLKPRSEPKQRFVGERRMPYRMMGEYVDRKKKTTKAKPKRKIVKKVVKKVKSKRK